MITHFPVPQSHSLYVAMAQLLIMEIPPQPPPSTVVESTISSNLGNIIVPNWNIIIYVIIIIVIE